MKLVKTTVALAICSTLSLSAVAATASTTSATADKFANLVNFYGRADLSAQSSDDGFGSFTEIKSNASRVGLKGGYKLNDDLEVVYKAEFQVAMDGGDNEDMFKARNQYVGLKGGFGEVLLGRNDSILKQSQGKVDLFNDLEGDIKVLWAGENRLKDTLTYKSPKFSGFQLGATYKAEETIEDSNGDDIVGEDSFSLAAFYGDKKLKKSKIFASIAIDSDVAGKAAVAIDSDDKKGYFDVVRATVQGKISDLTLGLIVQQQENVDTKEEMDGVLVSVKYKIGATTLKGQYQIADYKDADKNLTGMSAGIDYKLAKGTKLYAFYTSFDMDSTSDKDKDYLAAGIQYKF